MLHVFQQRFFGIHQIWCYHVDTSREKKYNGFTIFWVILNLAFCVICPLNSPLPSHFLSSGFPKELYRNKFSITLKMCYFLLCYALFQKSYVGRSCFTRYCWSGHVARRAVVSCNTIQKFYNDDIKHLNFTHGDSDWTNDNNADRH